MAIQLYQSSCPLCGKGIRITDFSTGEEICNHCGMVLHERLDQKGKEWRVYDKEDYMNRSRSGSSITLAKYDRGLLTVMGRQFVDASGRRLSASTSLMLKRLRTWDSRIQLYSTKSRNLKLAFTELDRLKHKLGITTEAVEEAANIYRKVLENDLVRGRSIYATLAAAVYAACRRTGIPRNIKEVCRAANIKEKGLTRTYRVIVNSLDLKMPLHDPDMHVVSVANKLALGRKVKKKASEIIARAKTQSLVAGRGPRGIAAGALYISSRLNAQLVTQKEIADTAGITEVTIRNAVKILGHVLNKKERKSLE